MQDNFEMSSFQECSNGIDSFLINRSEASILEDTPENDKLIDMDHNVL